MTNARMYWESVYAVHDGYDKGNLDYVYDKADEDYDDYSDYLPLKTKTRLHRKE